MKQAKPTAVIVVEVSATGVAQLQQQIAVEVGAAEAAPLIVTTHR